MKTMKIRSLLTKLAFCVWGYFFVNAVFAWLIDTSAGKTVQTIELWKLVVFVVVALAMAFFVLGFTYWLIQVITTFAELLEDRNVVQSEAQYLEQLATKHSKKESAQFTAATAKKTTSAASTSSSVKKKSLTKPTKKAKGNVIS